MSICSRCGNQVTEESKFCASCGTAISSSDAPSAEAGVPVSGGILSSDAPPPPPTTVGSAPPPPPMAGFAPLPPPAFVRPSGPPVARYCKGCGAGLVATAATCPTCGTRVAGGGGSGPKSKTTAVLLACFLSFWTWLYTYKKNTWKFWVGLVLGIAGIPLYGIPAIAVWIWAIIDVSIKPRSYYEEYDA